MTSFAVLFDLDGLLADTEPIWTASSERLLARRGHRWDPALKVGFMGRHPLEVARRMCEHYALADDPAALLDERLIILRALYDAEPLTALPGAAALVAALADEGVPLAVASGSPGELVRLVLARLALRDRVAAIASSDEVTHGKPAPDLFLLAARRLGAPASACVVLEDSAAGVAAALAAGMACVAVPGPETPAAAVGGADHVTRSLSELTPATLRAIVARRAAAPRPTNDHP